MASKSATLVSADPRSFHFPGFLSQNISVALPSPGEACESDEQNGLRQGAETQRLLVGGFGLRARSHHSRTVALVFEGKPSRIPAVFENAAKYFADSLVTRVSFAIFLKPAIRTDSCDIIAMSTEVILRSPVTSASQYTRTEYPAGNEPSFPETDVDRQAVRAQVGRIFPSHCFSNSKRDPGYDADGDRGTTFSSAVPQQPHPGHHAQSARFQIQELLKCST